MTARTMVAPAPHRPRIRRSRVALHAFLIAMATLWLFPLLWAVYTAFRPQAETLGPDGYVSFPKTLTLDNFTNAWVDPPGGLPGFYINTLIVVVPAVIVTLFLASMVAFALSKFNFRFNVTLLLLFTAGNLLPQQAIIVPLYQLYVNIVKGIPEPLSDNNLLYDQYVGVFLIQVVFQTGFCVFVLSNYMRTLSKELVEAAVVDGANVFAIYRRVILPLCRPALAALAALEFTFMYNDFFWALVLMKSGARRPITSALIDLQGQFQQNNNELAALSVLVAIPTIVLYIVLQKHFERGLSLGSTKG